MTRRRWIVAGAGLVVLAGLLGLYWFQPWKLVVDDPVNESLSSVEPTAPPTGSAAVQVIAQGTFVTHEHETTGTVRIIARPDGTRRLEIVGLATSNGPDLRVWLTDQPVIEGRTGWSVFDDGKYVELGRLKGNKGNQAYDVPAGLDLDAYRSVSIWCKRFAVSFGAATLSAA
jgi:hypothetical protein